MSHEENSQIPGQEMCSLNNDYTAASGKGEIQWIKGGKKQGNTVHGSEIIDKKGKSDTEKLVDKKYEDPTNHDQQTARRSGRKIERY